MGNSKLKIAVFHNVPAGGAKRAFFSFGKELCGRGHHVDYYKLDIFDEELFSVLPFVANTYSYKIRKLKYVKTGLPYFIQEYINLAKHLAYIVRLRFVYKKIAEDIDRERYDLAFVHNCMYTQAPLLLRYLKIPTVYYCHEPLRRVYEPRLKREDTNPSLINSIRASLSKPAEYIRKKMDKNLDRNNVLSADYVFTNSHFTRESAYKAYGVLSYVSYPGVDIEKFRPLNLSRKNYVLSIGVLDYLKQHDFVINSLALMDKKLRPKLIIVGNMSSETEKRFLTDLAKTKSVNLDMKFLISDDELVTLYNEAKAVVYPPLMEPFGLVPLEAMACGTPVIGVREGGIRETIMDGVTGILIDRDERECAQALTGLVTDEGLAKRMGEAGRKYVCEKWSWKTCTDMLEKNFAKVLNK